MKLFSPTRHYLRIFQKWMWNCFIKRHIRWIPSKVEPFIRVEIYVNSKLKTAILIAMKLVMCQSWYQEKMLGKKTTNSLIMMKRSQATWGCCKETFEKKMKPNFDKELREAYFENVFKQNNSNKVFQLPTWTKKLVTYRLWSRAATI